MVAILKLKPSFMCTISVQICPGKAKAATLAYLRFLNGVSLNNGVWRGTKCALKVVEIHIVYSDFSILPNQKPGFLLGKS